MLKPKLVFQNAHFRDHTRSHGPINVKVAKIISSPNGMRNCPNVRLVQQEVQFGIKKPKHAFQIAQIESSFQD
jgi:hypothetical protein